MLSSRPWLNFTKRLHWMLLWGFVLLSLFVLIEYGLIYEIRLTYFGPSSVWLAGGFVTSGQAVPVRDTILGQQDGGEDIEQKLLMVPEDDRLPVNCTKIFAGDQAEIEVGQRITNVTSIPNDAYVRLAKNCDQFKRRRRYLTVAVNKEEEHFPIAYSIQMYKDVVQLERLLRAIYRPQNVYCINVDKSSPADVHAGVEAIARCFDNVLLADVNVAWATFSQVKADLVCMRYLYNKSSDWKYLLTLTGQEFPLKTNLDLVLILKALNGSNAMVANIRKRFEWRWQRAGPPPINVTIVKGACHFAVTRNFVRYVLFNPGMENYTKWAKRTSFPDEHFFQSLSHSPQLGVPGAYTGYPESYKGPYRPITRYTRWRIKGRVCHGKWVRDVCVYGVGDLPEMANAYELFANKFYYDLQPMTLQCLEQRHYQWTRQDILGHRGQRLNMTFYRTLPSVKQHIPSGLEH